jgi:hypothetical protein
VTFCSFVTRSDPLTKRKRALSLEELADRDWVLYGPEHGLTHLIQTACARAGFVPRGAAQTGQGGGRASRCLQPRSDDRPQQRPTARPRRQRTKSQVATGSSTRSLHPPELVAASRSIPGSTRRHALGTTAPLGDGRGLVGGDAGRTSSSRRDRRGSVAAANHCAADGDSA